ncbi:NADPH-dependent oxidoreductase (plasmid) [Sphingobium fuliginis ATCC 27551]|uniref:NADPH-dependent oxidoreductase n=1 Tax=Sphingobium fuliginis ATCC 27551 TaxID=1208342 RepID=A0A5B8CP30_SPHSA|nr:NADPH-dependent oxidoreductase [Sphingobium fuliginis ATCC 27551]
MTISIVVGNPKPRSRTLVVAETLVNKIIGDGKHQVQTIDLVDVADHIMSWPNETVQALNRQVAASDLAIFASPTYKASYTGLLKAFLDRYPEDGLKGVVALPLFTGGSLAHSMGPNMTLAPLLTELGAVVPGKGSFFVMDKMDQIEATVGAFADTYISNMRSIAKVVSAVG